MSVERQHVKRISLFATYTNPALRYQQQAKEAPSVVCERIEKLDPALRCDHVRKCSRRLRSIPPRQMADSAGMLPPPTNNTLFSSSTRSLSFMTQIFIQVTRETIGCLEVHRVTDLSCQLQSQCCPNITRQSTGTIRASGICSIILALSFLCVKLKRTKMTNGNVAVSLSVEKTKKTASCGMRQTLTPCPWDCSSLVGDSRMRRYWAF